MLCLRKNRRKEKRFYKEKTKKIKKCKIYKHKGCQKLARNKKDA